MHSTREALNATNPFYQFLSFYKVIEGVRELRDEERRSEGRIGDERLERFADTIEEFPAGLKHAFPSLRGKKFKDVTKEYRSSVRNALAHLNPTSRHFSGDNYGHISQCESRIPIVRYIAREMLVSLLT